MIHQGLHSRGPLKSLPIASGADFQGVCLGRFRPGPQARAFWAKPDTDLII